MKKETFSISLRIRGGKFNGKNLSQILGLQPLYMRTSDRKDIIEENSELSASYWCHTFEFEPTINLDRAITIIADKLIEYIDVFADLRRAGSRVELFIGLYFESSSGHEIQWETLQKLSKGKIDLSLDIYAEVE